MDVGLLDDPHAHEDLAKTQAVARGLLPFERCVQLVFAQLVSLEQRLPQERSADASLEQLDDSALEVDVFNPVAVAPNLEGSCLRPLL